MRAGLNAMAVGSWSDTKIVIRPEDSPTATKDGPSPITVTNARGQTATYPNFSLIVPKIQPPTIITVALGAPATNPEDQTVTITGTNFLEAQGTGCVSITTPAGTSLQLSVQSWSSVKIVAVLHMSKEAMIHNPGTFTLAVTTAQNESSSTQVAIAAIHRNLRTAASKAPGPDMRPYILLALVAVLVGVGWLDLRRRRSRVS